jgi:hypothetical protein
MPINNRRMEDINDQDKFVGKYVNELLKLGIRYKIPSDILYKIRQDVNNDVLMNTIEEVFYEKLQYIQKKAIKFTKLIEKKYGNKGMPLHMVLKQSLKYKKRYSLSDLEYQEFLTNYQKLLYSRYPQYTNNNQLTPNTTMGKLFGDYHSSMGLITKDSDLPIIQELIDFYMNTRINHGAVIQQSLQYKTLDLEVKNAMYDKSKHHVTNSIYPLIAALFIPKIDAIEQHFLYSNIANIVTTKWQKQPLTNMADSKLLWSIINDSHDVVCNQDSPLIDLKLRANLQNSLWINVFNLRSSKFFEPTGLDFINAIDRCKITSYDAPDLLYIGDEGVILKRLLACFSFRPIVVSTMPIFGNNGVLNPVNFPIISNRVVSTPLLTLRLPINKQLNQVSLDDALTNTQIYLENGAFVPKTQQVIYTEGTIIFHVPRRNLEPKQMYENVIYPYPRFSNIPLNIYHLENVNVIPINYQQKYVINDKNFYLRSAVYLETQDINNNTIVLSTGALIRDIVENTDGYGLSWKYSPKLKIDTNSDNRVLQQIEFAEEQDLLQTRATIFIYSSDNE